MTIMKISPSKDSHRRVYFNVQESENPEASFPVWMNEIVNGEKIPGHKGRMFLKGKEGGNRWFELSAPLRRTDRYGNYEYQARRDQDGKFLDANGKIVEDESKAAKQYVYVTDNDNNIKYGLLASINIVNTKKDKNTGQDIPTRSTYLNVKLYSDSEAYDMAKTLFEFQNSTSDEEREELLAIMNEQKKTMGRYSTMFVDSGSEHLKELGFEFRTNEPYGDYTP